MSNPNSNAWHWRTLVSTSALVWHSRKERLPRLLVQAYPLQRVCFYTRRFAQNELATVDSKNKGIAGCVH